MHEIKSDIPEAVHYTARAPHKAGATGQAATHEFDRISVRQALCLFLEAYQYPHLGNEDELESRQLEQNARQRATSAIPEANDPPEFSEWLAVLIDEKAGADDVEKVYFAMLDDGPQLGLPIRRR